MNTDDRGGLIKDPREVPSTQYPVFASFFRVPRAGIRLSPSFPLLPASG